MIPFVPSASQMLPTVYTFGHKVGQLVRYYALLLFNTNTITLLSTTTTSSSSDNITCISSNYDDETAFCNTTATTARSVLRSSSDSYYTSVQDGAQQLYTMIITFPVWYSEWWWNLVQNDPIHVLVETILLLSIFYFLVSRRGKKSYKENSQNAGDRLTKQEEDELIAQWIQNERHPLTPYTNNTNSNAMNMNSGAFTSSSTNNSNGMNQNNSSNTNYFQQNDFRPTLVVHKSNGRFMEVEEIIHPSLAAVATTPNATSMTGVDQGTPTTTNTTTANTTTMAAAAAAASTLMTESAESSSSNNGNIIQVLNFATMDFLGMSADTVPPTIDEEDADFKSTTTTTTTSTNTKNSKVSTSTVVTTTTTPPPPLHPVKVASLEALDRYGCGSCGPRGFYGTIDVHLHIEKNIASFLCTEDAILYSDGASTVTSTVAAFCKRGDIIIVDEAVYEPIRTGVQLSRANVKWFAHNDMNDLRRVLSSIQQADKKRGRKSNAQRRFIVAEGLYKNTGTICPLDELIALKHEFSCRLILDESFSFGTLGPNGRGVTELYQQQLMYDVEITCVSLENAMGSIGGLTTGTEEVVDHQRLSGSGYAYSASSPPFTASAALAALNLLQTRPEITLQRLQRNLQYMHEQLQVLLHNKLEDLLHVTSDVRSPIILLQVADIPETEYLDEVVFLQEVVRESFFRGVAFVATATGSSAVAVAAAAAAAAGTTVSSPETVTGTPGGFVSDPPSGIRMTVSAVHTLPDIDHAIQVLGEAVDVVMSRFHEEETTM